MKDPKMIFRARTSAFLHGAKFLPGLSQKKKTPFIRQHSPNDWSSKLLDMQKRPVS